MKIHIILELLKHKHHAKNKNPHYNRVISQ